MKTLHVDILPAVGKLPPSFRALWHGHFIGQFPCTSEGMATLLRHARVEGFGAVVINLGDNHED